MTFLERLRFIIIILLLGTSATNWPVGPAPDDDECGAVGGMKTGRGNRSTW
jgi:hypothetical protein